MLTTRRIVLLAFLAAFAIVGRMATSFLPNIQPVTAVILLSGFLFGPIASALLAFVITFLSNMILGTGIWTIWQIVSWALIGVIAGVLGLYIKKLSIYFIIIYAILAGYLYGFVISLFTYQITGAFWPYYLAGLLFDTYHAIGNVVFVIILYPLFKKYLYKERVSSNS